MLNCLLSKWHSQHEVSHYFHPSNMSLLSWCMHEHMYIHICVIGYTICVCLHMHVHICINQSITLWHINIKQLYFFTKHCFYSKPFLVSLIITLLHTITFRSVSIFLSWGVIDICHYIIFRYTTNWFDTRIHYEMITTVSLVISCHFHSYKFFLFYCDEDF